MAGIKRVLSNRYKYINCNWLLWFSGADAMILFVQIGWFKDARVCVFVRLSLSCWRETRWTQLVSAINRINLHIPPNEYNCNERISRMNYAFIFYGEPSNWRFFLPVRFDSIIIFSSLSIFNYIYSCIKSGPKSVHIFIRLSFFPNKLVSFVVV